MDLVREKTLPQMRVGIVTFSAAYNYGAALQCRCLLEVLRGLGLEAYVLDYRPAYLTEPYKILKPYYFKKLSILLSLPWRFWGAWRRDRLFRQFQKTLSPVPFGAGGVDAVFFGSDQIWNPCICRGLDPVFFAAIPPFSATRNIAYAASDGSVPLTAIQAAEFQRYLQHFHRIGVREQSLQDRLSAWGVTSTVTLDPVLLAGRSVLDKMATYRQEGESYVLTYEAVDNPAVRSLAASLGPRKVISVAREPYSEGSNRYGPEEFVALVRDASSVVTTSFHGVALSLLYHKVFYYVETGSPADDRIRSLLTAIGLEGRMVPPGAATLPHKPIDYSSADAALSVLRARSLDFIKEALQTSMPGCTDV